MISAVKDRLYQFLGGGKGELPGLRKVLIGVAGILLALVLFQTAWDKYTSFKQGLQERIDLKAVQLEKQRRILEQSQGYRQKNKELKELREETVQTRLLQGDTPALAEAKLQNVINELAKNSQVNILSMRMLARKVENSFTILQIGINGRAEIGAIKDFLAQIELEERYMYITELEIKIVNRREKRYFNLSTQVAALASI